MNGDVVGGCVASSNDGLERILQLSEAQPGLGLTVPAAQHELVPIQQQRSRRSYKSV